MADAVASRVLFSGKHRYSILLLNVSDGTGESAVVKVDKSTLTNEFGVEPTRLNIARVEWTIQGFTHVILAFEHTADDNALVLGTGVGSLDFSKNGYVKDPASAGGTGDLVLTAPAGATTGSYSIKLDLVFG